MKNTTQKFTPILIFKDQKEIQDGLKPYKEAATALNRLIESLKSLGIQVQSLEKLTAYSRDPESLVRTTIVKGQSLNVGGLQLDSSKVAELVALPSLSTLEGNARAVCKFLDENSFQLENLEFVNGQVKVSPEFTEDIEALYSVFTQNAKQNEFYQLSEKICALANEARDSFNLSEFDRHNAKTFMAIRNGEGEFKPNISIIKGV
jgi:hypothetical protein